MTDDRALLLLDAQVAWVLADLTEPRLTATVHEDVVRVLDVLGGVPLIEAVDVAAVQVVVRRLVLETPTAPLVVGAGAELALDTHRRVAAETTPLGEVVDRDAVETLLARAIELRGAGDRLTDRIIESPTAVQVGTRLVGRVVADVLSQNRAVAEKVPGVASLLAIGTGAMSRAGKVGKAALGDLPLDRLVGDAVGAGAQATMIRTTAIVREVVTDEALLRILMELWDAQAARPVGDLLTGVEEADVVALLGRGRGVTASVARSDVVGGLVDAGVATFVERYAERDLTSLLADLGVTHQQLATDLHGVLVPTLQRLRADGTLERLVRERLAPFWSSPAVAAVLAEPAAPAT